MSTNFEWFADAEPAEQDPEQPGAGFPEAEPAGVRARATAGPGPRPDYRRRTGPAADAVPVTREHQPQAQPSRGPAAARPAEKRLRDADGASQESAGDRPEHREEKSAMAVPYPIVAQRILDDPVRHGPLEVRKRREKTDIPTIKAHEVLVWRVGERYIVDRRELRVTDDIVVRASSVSVVSVRPDTKVQVEFEIDSRDGEQFVVRVTFICSVKDPVIVVRDGQENAADALLAYLHGYQDLFQLGLRYSVSEINRIRKAMAHQVKAYMAYYPPQIHGIEISSATVQVETPATVGRIRELEEEQRIQEAIERGHARIEEQRQDNLLAKARKLGAALTDNPRDALIYAHAEGGTSSQDLAGQVQQAHEADEQRKHIDRIAESTRDYAVEDQRAEWKHEKDLWKRKQIEDQRQEDREDRRNTVAANLELLKVLAERGHLDTYNADVEDLIRRVRGDATAPQVSGGNQRSELTDGHAEQSGEREGDQ
jgi:hypothetical protein